MRNYDSDEFSDFFNSDNSMNGSVRANTGSARPVRSQSSKSNEFDNRNRRSDYNDERPAQKNRRVRAEEAKMRKKLRSSKKLGIILSMIQLFLSVALMLLLYFKKEDLPIIIDIYGYIGTATVLFLLFLIPLCMQFKRLLIKRIGKSLSVFISLVLVIVLIGYCKFYQPFVDLGGKEKVSKKPFTVYLSGNDTSGELSTTSNGRSDTNILAVVNPKTCTALLLTTPRDAYLELVAQDLPDGIYDKLTHAGIYGSGVKNADGKWGHGCDVSMNMLSKLYDVDVKHYMRINFTGFAHLVDALGGVELDVTESFSTQAYGRTYTFEEGKQTLNGLAALTYVRERHAFARGDLQRGANQVNMIKAIANQALSAKTFMNYDEIIDALGNSFETDLSIASLATLQIALQGSKDYNGWNIVSYAVDGSTAGGYQYCYSADQYLSVVTLDDNSVAVAKQLVKKVMDGEKITDKTAETLEKNLSGDSSNN